MNDFPENDIFVYRPLGALGMATNWSPCFAHFDGFEYLGRAHASNAAKLAPIPSGLSPWPAPGRWVCPNCNGRFVQITLPHWYRETVPPDTPDYRAGCLEPIQVDEDAKPLAWYCETCESSDIGQPIDGLRED